MRTISFGIGIVLLTSSVCSAGIMGLPGLESVSFYETSGISHKHTFDFDAPELTQRRADPLGPGNNDFLGTNIEYYDVFYSDADGTLNSNGNYISIEAVFNAADSALNIEGVVLHFSSGPDEIANSIASLDPGSEFHFPSFDGHAIDGKFGPLNLDSTFTLLGRSAGPNDRMRLTLGFASTAPVPEASTVVSWCLMGLTGVGVTWFRRRRR